MINKPSILIAALQDPACYDHPVTAVELVETHISWVLLAGDYAYKIKKPLDLGFLDFSTLEKRHHFCNEELRLNRRLAPQLYLEVVAITGTPETPELNGAGAPIEYAVKMAQFPQEAQLDRVLARGELHVRHIDSVAAELAAFHGRIAAAGADSPFGAPERVYQPIGQNFDQIRPLIETDDLAQLARLKTWSEQNYARLKQDLRARKRDGFIRECHGDVHLANMALIDDVQEHECREGANGASLPRAPRLDPIGEGQGRPGAADRVVIFDCLEFNETLRWIDVMNEVAFLVMDLDDRGRPDFARRALNTYLEHTGDYAGLNVFRFYQVYRALVRAKVACIRLGQSGLSPEERADVRQTYRGYTDLAERYTESDAPALIITHGLSGCGKTWLTQLLIDTMDVVRVRSDVERKRLHGLGRLARSGSGIATGLYTPEAGRQTYERLALLARTILGAGHAVIIDAAFLKREQRERLRTVADEMRVPFVILDVQAPEEVLRQRIMQREREGRDASEAGLAVLDHQLAIWEPLGADEIPRALPIPGHQPPSSVELTAGLRRLIQTD
ncbi:MAG: bifunctional aminoglycoside phosphotransferase/ATP-binding protein [Gammaproteobacteria bacterium]|nr:MAG: bifunctional aminoglycoside phosphotransferase/ATP-binding protein [Gammaproteobacteria bacterium]